MEKSEKEIIKILAETILKHYEESTYDGYKCRFCHGYTEMSGMVASDHKPDCPVLLAEEVLKEECVCGDLKTLPVNDGHGSTKECPYCKERKLSKEDTKRIYALAQEYNEEDFIHAMMYEKYSQDNIPDLSAPLIVHNVMKYKKEYYLKQISNNPSCEGCSCFIEGGDCIIPEDKQGECGLGTYIWKSFKDIQITDELACMRKDIGDIYITNRTKGKTIRFTHLTSKGFVEFEDTLLAPIAFELATTEEIQEYLNK